MVTRIARRLGLALVRVTVFFAVCTVVTFLWMIWSIARLDAFCAAAKPGTAVADIDRLAGEHGLDFVRAIRAADPTQGQTGLIVARRLPALSAECAVVHDGDVVRTARMVSL